MTNRSSIEELSVWLERDEASSRQYRVIRLSRLLEHVPPLEEGKFFFGGNSSLQAFTEMRLTYMHGLYLSTVLLALAFIEHELAGRLYAAGWEKAKNARLADLLSKAEERGIISDDENRFFQHLRNVRNSYTHYQPLTRPSSWLHRAVDQNTNLNDVLEADARQAVEALGAFLWARRSGFT